MKVIQIYAGLSVYIGEGSCKWYLNMCVSGVVMKATRVSLAVQIMRVVSIWSALRNTENKPLFLKISDSSFNSLSLVELDLSVCEPLLPRSISSTIQANETSRFHCRWQNNGAVIEELDQQVLNKTGCQLLYSCLFYLVVNTRMCTSEPETITSPVSCMLTD